jgi:hypothetical protein
VSDDEKDGAKRTGFWAFWTTLPGILTELAAVITAVAVLVTAFGGSSDSERDRTQTTTPGSVTESDSSLSAQPRQRQNRGEHLEATWIAKSNKVCRSALDQVRGLGPATSVADTEVPRLTKIIEIVRDTTDSLRALRAPPGHESVDRLLRLLDSWSQRASAANDATRAGNEPSYNQAVLAAEEIRRQVEPTATQLGVRSCADLLNPG